MKEYLLAGASVMVFAGSLYWGLLGSEAPKCPDFLGNYKNKETGEEFVSTTNSCVPEGVDPRDFPGCSMTARRWKPVFDRPPYIIQEGELINCKVLV